MEKKVIDDLIKRGLSTRQIAEEVGLSQTTVRYWLRKYNVSTNYERTSRKTFKERGGSQ